MKEPSLETQIHQAKEEGEKFAKQAKQVGNPAFTPPDSLPLMQEKEPNKFEVLAFQLEEFLQKPLVYTDNNGNEVQVAESAEAALEGEEGRKRLEKLGKDMAADEQRAAKGEDFSARDFLDIYIFLRTLPQDAQKIVLDAFQTHSDGKKFEEVLPEMLPVLGKAMATDAQRGMARMSGNAWRFFMIYTSLASLPEESQQIALDVFQTHSDGKTFEEVLPDILPWCGEEMVGDARRATEGKGSAARYFLHTYTSLLTLSPESQETILDTFKEHSDGKTFEEVLLDILPLVGKYMAANAHLAAEGGDPSLQSFLTFLTSLRTLITHYHKLANEQRAQEELHTSKKETTEPIIPPKNF